MRTKAGTATVTYKWDDDYPDAEELPLYYDNGVYVAEFNPAMDRSMTVTVAFRIGMNVLTLEESQAYVTEIMRTMKEREAP